VGGLALFQENKRGFDQEETPCEDVKAQVPQTLEVSAAQEQVGRARRVHMLEDRWGAPSTLAFLEYRPTHPLWPVLPITRETT
jgi:hypothetical protein